MHVKWGGYSMSFQAHFTIPVENANSGTPRSFSARKFFFLSSPIILLCCFGLLAPPDWPFVSVPVIFALRQMRDNGAGRQWRIFRQRRSGFLCVCVLAAAKPHSVFSWYSMKMGEPWKKCFTKNGSKIFALVRTLSVTAYFAWKSAWVWVDHPILIFAYLQFTHVRCDWYSKVVFSSSFSSGNFCNWIATQCQTTMNILCRLLGSNSIT